MVSTPDIEPTIGILTGPTATGKTTLALRLAGRHGSIEIINADSLLIYSGMNIGTAKPPAGERAAVPHHLIDIRQPHEPFTAGDFRRAASDAITEILSRGKRPLIVGGSGFYLKALLHGLWNAPKATPEVRRRIEAIPSAELYRILESRDAAAARRIGGNDRYRLVRAVELLELSGKTPEELQAERPRLPDPRFELWVLDRPSEELQLRITARTRAMIGGGWIEETRELLQRYPERDNRPRVLESVGYAQVIDFLEGRSRPGRKVQPGIAGLLDEIDLATRQLVKKQRTWFRGEARARWFHLDDELTKLEARWDAIYGGSSLPGTPGKERLTPRD